ncbi:MAG: peptidoglycan DD-metalloendopeptidase family protein [Bacteroidales bacterium]|nr:peptidoglycan DD-metalloendopeptidase family protein [Bacteroidales bacterium]
MILKKFSILLFLIPSIIFSQVDSLADDFSDVLDTIEYQGEKIVLYKNNSWTFLSSIDQLKRDELFCDTSMIFKECWNTNMTFTYGSSGTINDSIVIPLIDSVRKFVLPHYGSINSGFGWRGRREHKAIDINLDVGTPVRAAFDGKVRYAQYNKGGYGKLIIIRHFNGLETYYAHLSKIYVKPNQIVKAGQIIGAGGNTGASWTGAHLHFEVRWKDHAFDPLKIIDFENQKLKSDTLVLKPSDFKVVQDHKAYARNLVNGDKPMPRYGGVTTPTQTNPNKASPSNDKLYQSVKPGTYHMVQKGESLWSIANKYGTTVENLCKLNNIQPNSVIQIGQKIRIK